MICHLLRQHRVKKVNVPPSFPLGLALELRQKKIKVKLCKQPVFPCRAIKTKDEVKKISASLIMAEVGLAEGLQALKSSKIAKSGNLLYHNAPLTSEKLRSIIDIAILKAGGTSKHTIVAGGLQACDPYEEGSGTLQANKPIIIDIFPRSQVTGYFGDITRTVVKGRASEEVRKMYHTVACAQAAAFDKMRDNTPASEVHRCVEEFFKAAGYLSRKNKGRMEGFCHSTGHGVGLELHEAPQVGSNSQDILIAGHVATVEPGLYYPEIGAVRLEDVVHITSHAPKNLTRFEKVLEIN
jgi:Xaa-Pro aminopeptidase